MVAILLCYDIVQRLQQKWWLDSANIPWSAGDIAAMQHGSVADAAAIPELRGVPNVAVSYYDIDASDLKGIRWALWASALHGEGQLHNALSTWRYDWNWDPAPDGQCGVARARISFRAHVTLPRLTRPESLSPEVSQRWQAFMARLFEPVVAGFVGYLAGERLGLTGYVGAFVILVGIVIAESRTWRAPALLDRAVKGQ